MPKCAMLKGFDEFLTALPYKQAIQVKASSDARKRSLYEKIVG